MKMDSKDLRLLEEERRQAENAWLNSATDIKEFIAMRKALPKLVGRPDLPRDQMTAAVDQAVQVIVFGNYQATTPEALAPKSPAT